MKTAGKLFPLIFLSAIVATACVPGDTHEAHDTHSTTHDKLPESVQLLPATKALLIREMLELQKGMKEIAPALVAAEWQSIATIGNRMHDSYIMKQSLTEAQMHELHTSLPAAFQQLDQAFHRSAEQMALAAENHDSEKVAHHYFRLTETCIECHTKYAAEKFPQFSRSKAEQ